MPQSHGMVKNFFPLFQKKPAERSGRSCRAERLRLLPELADKVKLFF